MDYEKKYNEALKRAEAAINIAADKDLVKGVATTIFPELRESEDERVRQTLIDMVKRETGFTGFPSQGQVLAYLEKQKEQKPAWSEEDEKMIERLITRLNWITNDTRTDGTSPNITFFEEIDWLKSLRPVKQEWDTYDKAIVNCIVCCLDGQFVPEAARKQALKWFNKHRRDFLNSPSWKPSEEQMDSLRDTIVQTKGYSYSVYLPELYEQLKKLI